MFRPAEQRRLATAKAPVKETMAVHLGVVAAGVLLVLLIAAPLGHGGPALLTADFETEPTKLGWKIGGYPHEKPKG